MEKLFDQSSLLRIVGDAAWLPSPDDPWGPAGADISAAHRVTWAMLNPQPIRRLFPAIATQGTLAYVIARQEASGIRDAIEPVSREVLWTFVDDFCGTPPIIKIPPPYPWPWPWPWPWPDPDPWPILDERIAAVTPTDLVLAGLHLQRTAERMGKTLLTDDLLQGSIKLIEAGMERL